MPRVSFSRSPADAAALCRQNVPGPGGVASVAQQLNAFLEAYRRNRASRRRRAARTLLSSPHFGERWARLWLDIARFADSNGFEKDLLREMWAWRTWVIQAFNDDMPYDRFLVEQIAGDLLPNPTQDQIVATGFLRNSMTNEEAPSFPSSFACSRCSTAWTASARPRWACPSSGPVPLPQVRPHFADRVYGMFAFLNNTYEAQSWVYTKQQQADRRHTRQGQGRGGPPEKITSAVASRKWRPGKRRAGPERRPGCRSRPWNSKAPAA